MNQKQTTRILVVTDHPEPTAELIAMMEQRADLGSAQFRVVVPNPAQAEVHLLHPDRHEKAREAEEIGHRALTDLERVTGSRVIGTVSVRHHPIDAIEEIIFSEPIDEVILFGRDSWPRHPPPPRSATSAGALRPAGNRRIPRAGWLGAQDLPVVRRPKSMVRTRQAGMTKAQTPTPTILGHQVAEESVETE